MAGEHRSWLVPAVEPRPAPGSQPTPTVWDEADPLDVFARLRVHVQFDGDGPRRRAVTRRVPGHEGTWLLAYSSYIRFVAANDGDDQVEYSEMRGDILIENTLPELAGLWLDHGFPDGRKILLPRDPLSELLD
jgi:hypothetical protein